MIISKRVFNLKRKIIFSFFGKRKIYIDPISGNYNYFEHKTC